MLTVECLIQSNVSKIEELRQTMLTLSHSGDDLAKTLAGALTITRTPKDQFSDKVRVRRWTQLSILLSFLSHTLCIGESRQADWQKIN